MTSTPENPLNDTSQTVTNTANPFEKSPQLSLGQLYGMTSVFAQYEDYPDPELLLRKGLLEESFEFLESATFYSDNHLADTVAVEGELGDVLWYISEIARFKNIEPTPPDSAGTPVLLEDYAIDPTALDGLTPIFDPDGNPIKPDEDDKLFESLAIATLRVVDVLNPKTDGLWVGIGVERPDLSKTLSDLLVHVGIIANKTGLLLTNCIENTLNKLANRARIPHVVDEAQQRQSTSSGRERLSPWVVNATYEYVNQDQALKALFIDPEAPSAQK